MLLENEQVDVHEVNTGVKPRVISFTAESWCTSQGKRRIGVPTYEGSGSHFYRGQRYRFLVIPRYGIDIGKLFLSHRRKLPTKLVNKLAVQMVSFSRLQFYCMYVCM